MPYEGSKVMSEEPDVLIGHVRICGGPGGQPLGLPGTGSAGKGACLPVTLVFASGREIWSLDAMTLLCYSYIAT